jgi:hypothetical protein
MRENVSGGPACRPASLRPCDPPPRQARRRFRLKIRHRTGTVHAGSRADRRAAGGRVPGTIPRVELGGGRSSPQARRRPSGEPGRTSRRLIRFPEGRRERRPRGTWPGRASRHPRAQSVRCPTGARPVPVLREPAGEGGPLDWAGDVRRREGRPAGRAGMVPAAYAQPCRPSLGADASDVPSPSGRPQPSPPVRPGRPVPRLAGGAGAAGQAALLHGRASAPALG